MATYRGYGKGPVGSAEIFGGEDANGDDFSNSCEFVYAAVPIYIT